MTFSTDDKRIAALREFTMRKLVYPRRVAEGKMKAAQAEYEIAVMEAIADDYRNLSEQERLL